MLWDSGKESRFQLCPGTFLQHWPLAQSSVLWKGWHFYSSEPSWCFLSAQGNQWEVAVPGQLCWQRGIQRIYAAICVLCACSRHFPLCPARWRRLFVLRTFSPSLSFVLHQRQQAICTIIHSCLGSNCPSLSGAGCWPRYSQAVPGCFPELRGRGSPRLLLRGHLTIFHASGNRESSEQTLWGNSRCCSLQDSCYRPVPSPPTEPGWEKAALKRWEIGSGHHSLCCSSQAAISPQKSSIKAKVI